METFDIVFDALCDTATEVANLKLRAELMLGIRERVRAWGITQGQAASRLGLTHPRLNDLLRGKIDKFSLDELVNIAVTAGLSPHIALAEAA
jgi:predicted XRE-type DNA-binding protein